MKKKTLDLLKDTLLFATGSIGSKLILFVMVPIYTNYLTEAEYGISELVFSMGQLLIPFLSLVIFDAVVRFGLSKEERAEDVLLIGLLVFAAGSLVTVAITPLFGLYDALAEWKWYMCIYIIFNMLCSILGCYVKSVDKNKLYAAVSILQTLVMALLNVLLLVVWCTGVRGYLLSTIVASILASVVLFVFGGMAGALKKASFRPELLKKMVAFSAPLILNNVSWWVIHSSDKVMIEWMVGAAALGIYTVAAKIPALINVLISIFSQAWGISSIKEAESEDGLAFYSDVFGVYSMIAFGACIAITAVIKPFMSIYVGDAFAAAWKLVPLLLLSASLSAVGSYFGSLYGVLKKSAENMATTLVGAGVNLVINYFLILRIGVMGAVIGTVAAYFVIAFLRLHGVRRYISIRVKWSRFYLSMGIATVQAICVAAEFYILPVSALAILLFAGTNGKLVYRWIRR